MNRGFVGTLLALLVVTAPIGAVPLYAQSTAPDGDGAQLTALLALRAVSRTPVETRLTPTGFPRDVLARVAVEGRDPASRALAYLRTYRDLYRWTDPRSALGVRRVSSNRALRLDSVVLYQTYDGLPVHGGELVVHVAGNEVVGSVGAMLHDVSLDTHPTTTPSDAENVARRAVGFDSPKLLSATELVILDPSILSEREPATRLAWQVLLDDGSRVFVDAHTLEVLRATRLLADAWDFDMQTAEEESEATTSGCFFFSIDPTTADENHIFPAYAGDPDVAGLFNFAHASYDFYKQSFNRKGYDGNDSEHDMYVHAAMEDDDGNPTANAAYVTGCDLWEFSTSMVTQDVTTHEFTHGVIHATADLDQDAPAGALDESYSDIMAALHTNDWMLGEGTPAASPTTGWIRNCQFPPKGLDQFSERSLDEDDDFGRHANANFMNYAAFLLADGGVHQGTNVKVNGIGRSLVKWLYFNTMTILPSSADYADARFTTLLVAITSQNFTAAQLCSIRNAFGAVEVGLPDLDCDGKDDQLGDADLDGIPDAADNCVNTYNPGQKNLDGDTLGDACDLDDDNDLTPDATDNCPTVYNFMQEDKNLNGIGDACDPFIDKDTDGDGKVDYLDNCPAVPNPYQQDMDWDGKGDACDPDTDGDGFTDDNDNCQTVVNPNQADADGDFLGDACDKCPNDPDSLLKQNINYPPDGPAKVEPPSVPDTDGDGIPDACDPSNDTVILLIDGAPYTTRVAPKPDTRPHTVTVSGAPGGVITVPLQLCNGLCAGLTRRSGTMRLDFLGLDPQVIVAVRDDHGHAVAHARGTGRDTRTRLRFEQRGGRRYDVVFNLGPRFGGDARFTVVQTGRPAPKVAPPRVPVS